jgi:hypothetical protein
MANLGFALLHPQLQAMLQPLTLQQWNVMALKNILINGS